MRYVVERIERSVLDDDIRKDMVVTENEAEANAAFCEATHTSAPEGKWNKVVLWMEFDSIEEAPANDGCCYKLVDDNGKRTLRRCSAAQG